MKRRTLLAVAVGLVAFGCADSPSNEPGAYTIRLLVPGEGWRTWQTDGTANVHGAFIFTDKATGKRMEIQGTVIVERND